MSRLTTPDNPIPDPTTVGATESSRHCNGARGDAKEAKADDAAGTQESSGPKGASPSSGDTTSAEAKDRLDRAEEFMDQVGQRVGFFTSAVGLYLFRAAAHAREAAADLWAEAQSIRRGEPHDEHHENPPAS
jgi:hypothetical protein